MKKNKNFFKKAQAVVLVLAMIVSLAFPLQGMQVLADGNATATTTNEIKIHIDYAMEINYQQVSDNSIDIVIKSVRK